MSDVTLIIQTWFRWCHASLSCNGAHVRDN